MARLTQAELLACIPERAVTWETAEDGRVTLLRPKFLSPRLAWLQRVLWRPVFRVRLDARGSLAWTLMDGRDLAAVCAGLRERFGAEAEPVEERTTALAAQMASGGFLRLRRPETPMQL